MFCNREFMRLAVRLCSIVLLLNASLVFALAWPFSWLWNVTLVQFGLPTLSYTAALGILFLWSILRMIGPQFTSKG
jgi:hypothetical protein